MIGNMPLRVGPSPSEPVDGLSAAPEIAMADASETVESPGSGRRLAALLAAAPDFITLRVSRSASVSWRNLVGAHPVAALPVNHGDRR